VSEVSFSADLKKHLYNEQFTNHKKKYLLQCFAACFVAFLALLSLTAVSNGFIIASIASSAFVVFTVPHSPSVRGRSLLGGYIIGSLAGVLCSYMLSALHPWTPFEVIYDRAFFGALSVGISMLFMLRFKVPHPPACAISLALVLNPWEIRGLLVTVASVFILILSQRVLRKHLINLV
jgi:CBS-domain-containing membrane protein